MKVSLKTDSHAYIRRSIINHFHLHLPTLCLRIAYISFRACTFHISTGKVLEIFSLEKAGFFSSPCMLAYELCVSGVTARVAELKECSLPLINRTYKKSTVCSRSLRGGKVDVFGRGHYVIQSIVL